MKSNQAEPSVPKSLKRIQQNLQRPEINRILALGVIVIIIYLIAPQSVRLGNLNLILAWGSIYGIMALGEMLVLLVGGIDLSIGGMIAFSNVWAAILITWYGFPIWVGVVISLLSCLGIGFISGYLSTRFSPPLPLMYPAFIFTLSIHFMLFGATQGVTHALPIHVPKAYGVLTASLLGIPLPLVYMIVIALVMSFFLYRKPIGWSIYATGQDDEAARVTGVNISKVRIIAFMVSALLIGFGGILNSSMVKTATFQIGIGSILLVIAATVVGGVSLAGGEGSPPMAIIGGFMIYLITNSVVALGIPPFFQYAFLGILIIGFVIYDFFQS